MDVVVLAHQGGWDEALMVLVPIAAFVGLLMLANKRAKAIQAERQATRQGSTTPSEGAPADQS
jgi:UPF0716 family protein affecting phage T7 exclusion